MKLYRAPHFVSGGQTGVDRAALDVAVAEGRPYSGWCPLGGWAEDLPAPPGLLTRYSSLRETPTVETEQRTAWNVRDSDATLIIVPDANLELSRGTLFARICAEIIFLRPCYVFNLGSDEAASMAKRWLARVLDVSPSAELWLNIAGPRESESPGIYEAACRAITELFRSLD